ncbi:MAG TPA: peroxiredoxin [Gammaproteobacteria bacterium]
MLKPGTQSPDFTLLDQDGNAVRLSDLLAQGPVLLYFYPADFTPGCTKEACGLRDRFPTIEAKGMTIAGVSPQSPDSHRRFREEHGLPFTLLSDEDKTVIREYDCDGPLGIGVRRATYLIDPKDTGGIIRDAVLADFRIGRHMDFIERATSTG